MWIRYWYSVQTHKRELNTIHLDCVLLGSYYFIGIETRDRCACICSDFFLYFFLMTFIAVYSFNSSRLWVRCNNYLCIAQHESDVIVDRFSLYYDNIQYLCEAGTQAITYFNIWTFEQSAGIQREKKKCNNFMYLSTIFQAFNPVLLWLPTQE